MASGIVVHGPHYREVAEQACAGPVATLPLAYSSPELPPARPLGARMVVATIGHINQNKRAEAVIEAIAGSERLRNRVLYMLAGPAEADEQARLLTLARRLGILEPHFTGWVPDDIMHMLIAGADVMCCLRYPALEGGSASLITAMLSGRPTLVSDHAGYSELPDDLVMKCAPGHEAADVMRHLEAILDDPAAAQAMGERARAYALQAFSPATYAAKLLQALDAATQAEPAIRTARMVGKRLAELGIRAGDPAVERLNTVLAGMLRG
jgi:glycosyltransferase involved in cell wall biosynthesis